MRLLRPFARGDTYRSLVFLLAALPLAAVVLALLIAGWTTTLVLAITPLVIFVLVGFRGAVGLVARVDAALARGLLDVETRPPISSGGQWFWGRGKAVLADGSFWRQQAYLAIRMTAGFAIAVGLVSLLGGGAPGDHLPDHVPLVERGLRLVARRHAWPRAALPPGGHRRAARAVHLIGPLAALWRRLVSGLLAAPEPARAGAGLARGAPPGARLRRRRLGRARRARDGDLGADRGRLLLARVADHVARARRRDPRLGRARRGAAAVAARRRSSRAASRSRPACSWRSSSS